MIAWICLDIETAEAPPEAIEAAINGWKAPSTWKPETVAAKRREVADRYRDKAALMDASPIICIALITDQGHQIILNGMDTQHYPIENWDVVTCGNEQGMLKILRDRMNTMGEPDTTIVGHNHRSFDLPKLRQAFIRHHMKLPELIRPRVDDEPPVRMADTMSLVRSFSMELRDEKFISLDRVATVLGIDRPKQIITGADVPGLYRQGQYQAICTYCAIDCTCTVQAYLLMTSQHGGLE